MDLRIFLAIMMLWSGRPTRWVRRARGWARALLVRGRTEQTRTVVVHITGDASKFADAMKRASRATGGWA